MAGVARTFGNLVDLRVLGFMAILRRLVILQPVRRGRWACVMRWRRYGSRGICMILEESASRVRSGQARPTERG